MNASVTRIPVPSTATPSPVGPWLEQIGLNGREVALVRAHWLGAERLVDALFALAGALRLVPRRLETGIASGHAHVRHV